MRLDSLALEPHSSQVTKTTLRNLSRAYPDCQFFSIANTATRQISCLLTPIDLFYIHIHWENRLTFGAVSLLHSLTSAVRRTPRTFASRGRESTCNRGGVLWAPRHRSRNHEEARAMDIL
jgi:hypothetical protein